MGTKGLQIGNYVQDIISGEWMIVDELGENIGATLINRDKYPLPDGWQMGPIPLTPEILEKAGFVKCKNGIQLTVLDGYVFIGSLFSGFPLTLEIDGNRMPLHHVKYFHQLQNLYFALTGEEIKIEL